jgi:putative hemolysin
MSRLCRPVIWLLSVCTDLVVRIFGGDPSAARELVSEAELRRMVADNTSLSKDERKLIDEVFGAGDRQLREVLVPRTEVVFLDASTPILEAAAEIAQYPHSRYPVIDESADNVVGFVHVRDLLSPGSSERTGQVSELTRPALFLPGTKHVLDALSEMRRDSFHLAIVVDEYGGTAGIVTLEDLVEEVIGDIRDEYDNARADVIRLRGGGLDLSGLVNLDEAAEVIGVRLPEGPYETLAGFLIAQLGRLPRAGDEVVYDDLRFTVHSMDGRRASRVRIAHLTDEAEPQQPPAATTPAIADR